MSLWTCCDPGMANKNETFCGPPPTYCNMTQNDKWVLVYALVAWGKPLCGSFVLHAPALPRVSFGLHTPVVNTTVPINLGFAMTHVCGVGWGGCSPELSFHTSLCCCCLLHCSDERTTPTR